LQATANGGIHIKRDPRRERATEAARDNATKSILSIVALVGMGRKVASRRALAELYMRQPIQLANSDRGELEPRRLAAREDEAKEKEGRCRETAPESVPERTGRPSKIEVLFPRREGAAE
ncbi:hypothetical protein THAOC_21136, partial [Thalassiosira oceanica]